MIEMKVAGIALDAVSRSPIVLLKDASDRRALPIYISQEQAKAIVNALEKQTPPRPFTHDLMVNIFDSCDIKVERIAINSLQDNTFYASISINNNGQIREIDARPSDAIAIAIRTKAPIWGNRRSHRRCFDSGRSRCRRARAASVPQLHFQSPS